MANWAKIIETIAKIAGPIVVDKALETIKNKKKK